MSRGETLKGLSVNNPVGAEEPRPEGPQREARQGDCVPPEPPPASPFLPPFSRAHTQRWFPKKSHIHISGASGQQRGRVGPAGTRGRPCPGWGWGSQPTFSPACAVARAADLQWAGHPGRVTHRELAAQGLHMGHPVPGTGDRDSGSPFCHLQRRLPPEPRRRWVGQGELQGPGVGAPTARPPPPSKLCAFEHVTVFSEHPSFSDKSGAGALWADSPPGLSLAPGYRGQRACRHGAEEGRRTPRAGWSPAGVPSRGPLGWVVRDDPLQTGEGLIWAQNSSFLSSGLLRWGAQLTAPPPHTSLSPRALGGSPPPPGGLPWLQGFLGQLTPQHPPLQAGLGWGLGGWGRGQGLWDHQLLSAASIPRGRIRHSCGQYSLAGP